MARETLQLFNAETYCQELIKKMEQNPENHEFWEAAIVNVDNPCVGLTGPTGGSPKLAARTLTRLNEIHFPNCSLSKKKVP